MSTAKLIHALCTDPGRVRRHNEDAAAAAPGLGAYVVCDGMGGAAAGEIASKLAINAFLQRLTESARGPLTPGMDGSSSTRARSNGMSLKPQTRLHAAVHMANEAVFHHATELPEYAGMGTTLVALLHVPGPAKDRRLAPRSPQPRFVLPPTLFLANVGDSRCYRRRGGELLQLSTDHSFVEEQVLAGQITADQAAMSPMRNYITRAIGPQTHVEPDIQCYRTQPGDLYLLATDGLTRELADGDVRDLLARTIPTPSPTEAELRVACSALVEAANERGGHDNITVLLLAFV